MTTLTCEPATTNHSDLSQILTDVAAVVPPLWPLTDYVAVNPFVGLSHLRFLEARSYLRQFRDCELLLPIDYFRARFREGELTELDIEEGYLQVCQDYPDYYEGIQLDELRKFLDDSEEVDANDERPFRTVAEALDQLQGGSWTSHILNDVTRHCAAHYDEGQAMWSSPWKGLPLFSAWRQASIISSRMDQLGLSGFRELVRQLPASPERAIADLLSLMRIPPECWKSFLLCQLYSVPGWASYVRRRAAHSAEGHPADDDLAGLLAIRLAYDAALAQTHDQQGGFLDRLVPSNNDLSCYGQIPTARPSKEVLARHLFQVSMEMAYRRNLCSKLTSHSPRPGAKGRRELQMVFCIDVRSEVYRRHLEAQSDDIETFGFAGFFGLPFEYVSLGHEKGSAQCPVLLQPSFRVAEGLSGADEATREKARDGRRMTRVARKLWKTFQTSAATCFSFVESLGIVYFIKLLTDSLRFTRPITSPLWDRSTTNRIENLGLDLRSCGDDQLPETRGVELAEGFLRNLGLCTDFARIVVICGHATDVVNNPYKASLECGACGGHSGEPNARVAATLLNNPRIRMGLAERGIQIPDDCWFVPAVHNTATDDIRLLDMQSIPDMHRESYAQVVRWIRAASAPARGERSNRFPDQDPLAMFRRRSDWSELRPEWGLAGNAALIVAPRSRTAGLDLQGRTFLHGYDATRDPKGQTLELIMTAPMIVASWINLQYYASSVDNQAFGSGNKAIHNVVGLMGILQGNGGDLMTGLPWQCLHDGQRFQHEPLRLLVVIEAPREAIQRVIHQHQHVQDLVTNGWLTLMALEDDQCHRWHSDGYFVPFTASDTLHSCFSPSRAP